MSVDSAEGPNSGPREPRVIKRYANRKLYDARESRYVTLIQIAEMIRANEIVQIIDNATKEDKTDLTFALIIAEELKVRPRGIPLATLKVLIRQRSEKILGHLRDSPIRLLMAKDQAAEETQKSEETAAVPSEDLSGKETEQKGVRATLEQWQQTVDECVRAALPKFSMVRDLQAELKRLSDRIAAIEKRLRETKRD
jgi:polyhydroxyalkanoate synthesis regulator protein